LELEPLELLELLDCFLFGIPLGFSCSIFFFAGAFSSSLSELLELLETFREGFAYFGFCSSTGTFLEACAKFSILVSFGRSAAFFGVFFSEEESLSLSDELDSSLDFF
jgi:hypothetical protein